MQYANVNRSKSFVFYLKKDADTFFNIADKTTISCDGWVCDTTGKEVYQLTLDDIHVGVNNVKVTIPARVNVIPDGKDFSNYWVFLSVQDGADVFSFKQAYGVVPFVPLACSEDDVRTTLGVGTSVLSDEMIDLYGAFNKLNADTSGKLLESLAENSTSSRVANRAVVLKAAIALCPQLKILVPKSESDVVVSQSRFNDIDFDGLQAKLEDELGQALADVTGEADYSVPTFVIGDLTDIVTGE